MHPFVALMRRYCIDYTNTHDQSVCDSIMEPDYVVHIGGFDLPGLPDDRPHCAISCREASVVAAHRRLIEELTS